MKRSEVTFAQLDRVLRSLGFTWRTGNRKPPGRIYEQKKTGATILLPAYEDNERVYEVHLLIARTELENFGIADPTTFDAQLQKAG